jgi:hypothetical protein
MTASARALRQHLRMQLKQARATSVPERNQPRPCASRRPLAEKTAPTPVGLIRRVLERVGIPTNAAYSPRRSVAAASEETARVAVWAMTGRQCDALRWAEIAGAIQAMSSSAGVEAIGSTPRI